MCDKYVRKGLWKLGDFKLNTEVKLCSCLFSFWLKIEFLIRQFSFDCGNVIDIHFPNYYWIGLSGREKC